ncbi:formylglycine-generating enzyme family protein [Carboxylicivirga sp. RSCT41]|uniref:formylglycine-generating enzyme family protein n=1 Tax=Carboxylicivirga agarovorans TaxID=3417570 RepID=UPI003D331B3D
MKSLSLFILLFTSTLTFSQNAPEGMLLISGGEFIMGKDYKDGKSASSPAHKVKLNSFYMDTHEVTNAEYHKFCLETGHRLPEFWNTDVFRSGEKYPDYPVIGVSYGDALEYAKWAGKRLPTEAEWEYAARGGKAGKAYPNGNKWEYEKDKSKPDGWLNLIHPVGSHSPANNFGLHDMAGNAWEWVADKFSADYYSQSEYDNPKGPESGNGRVIRGGSWHSGPMCKRVFYRKGLSPGWCDFAVGFRCVKDL